MRRWTCNARRMTRKRIVYLLRSLTELNRPYVGLTHDVEARLADHNAGRCPYTARHRPWQLHMIIEFPDDPRAIRFERYPKSGSGRAFAKRHLNNELPPQRQPSPLALPAPSRQRRFMSSMRLAFGDDARRR